MRNWFVLLSLLCILACSSEQKQSTSNDSGVKFQQTDLPEIIAQANKQKKLVMIDVYSDG